MFCMISKPSAVVCKADRDSWLCGRNWVFRTISDEMIVRVHIVWWSCTVESSLLGHTPCILVLGIDLPLFRWQSLSLSSGRLLVLDVLNVDSMYPRHCGTCSHHREDPNLDHYYCNFMKSLIIQSRFLFKCLECVSRALDWEPRHKFSCT